MHLRSVHIERFKSIESLTLDLAPLTVLVGANNSGKSNILHALTLLGSGTTDLIQAISSRGGTLDHLCRRQAFRAENMSVGVTFVLTEEERKAYLGRSQDTAPNVSLHSLLKTPIFETLTYVAEIDDLGFTESLRTPNVVRGAGPTELCRVRYNFNGSYQKASAGIEALVRLTTLADVLPEFGPTVEYTQSGGFGGDRAALCSEADQPTHSRDFDADLPRRLFSAVRQGIRAVSWISPGRIPEPWSPLGVDNALSMDAHNLGVVLHTLYSNELDVFHRIEREVQGLVPGLGRFTVPTFRAQGEDPAVTALAIGDLRRPVQVPYMFEQLGFGVRAAVAIVTAVLTAPPGHTVLIEEPEVYFHPAAQARLFEFLVREAQERQIVVVTHAPLIASRCPVEGLVLVERNVDDATVVTRVRGAAVVSRVIEQLGVGPGISFDAEVIVFVEGRTDVAIFETWLERDEALRRRVQFVGADGGSTMSYFANAKVLKSMRAQPRVLVVFDGDTERGEKQKKFQEQLISELPPATEVLTLSVSEVEGCLLDPDAIVRAFPEAASRREELAGRLVKLRSKRDQKGGLDKLLTDLGLGRYGSEPARRIAAAMTAVPGPALAVFERARVALEGQLPPAAG